MVRAWSSVNPTRTKKRYVESAIGFAVNEAVIRKAREVDDVLVRTHFEQPASRTLMLENVGYVPQAVVRRDDHPPVRLIAAVYDGEQLRARPVVGGVRGAVVLRAEVVQHDKLSVA